MYNDAHFGAPLSTLAAELEAGRSDLRLTLCDKEPKCPAPGAKPYLRRSHYFKKQARSMLSRPPRGGYTFRLLDAPGH